MTTSTKNTNIMANSERIYLIQGNDTDMSVCLRKGGDTPLPYDLTGASRIGLALTGHGLSFFARDIVVSGEDNNIISGLLAGDLLVGEYGLEPIRSGWMRATQAPRTTSSAGWRRRPPTPTGRRTTPPSPIMSRTGHTTPYPR